MDARPSGRDDCNDVWGAPYHEELAEEIEDWDFRHLCFALMPALVSEEDGLTVYSRYRNEPIDPARDRIDPVGWCHEHCHVCHFSIEPGHSYWENADECCLCDACYEHYSVARGKPGAAES